MTTLVDNFDDAIELEFDCGIVWIGPSSQVQLDIESGNRLGDRSGYRMYAKIYEPDMKLEGYVKQGKYWKNTEIVKQISYKTDLTDSR